MRAQREDAGTVGSFSRGSELWMHQTRLFLVGVRNLCLLWLVFFLVVGSVYYFSTVTPLERYALERNLNAKLRHSLGMTAGKIELNLNNESVLVSVDEAIHLTEEDAADAMVRARNAMRLGGFGGLALAFLIALGWWQYGRARMQDDELRGARLVSGPDLARLMRERNETSPYQIAGVPMRARSESLHTLFAGAQGTGKSQQFFSLMAQVRKRNKRMIVYDPTGEFTEVFYRPGRDILMNPLDARSPCWSVWNEIHHDYHFDNIANGLIPAPVEADPFFAEAGRMVLKDVIAVLGREGRRKNSELYGAIARSNLEEMFALLQGTAGASYVDPITERTGMSLKMTVQNQLECFRFLHDNGEPFSIRQWVQTEGDSWMFITARESQREVMKPLLSLWIDTAIKAVLDLPPTREERLWFAIDELPTLQKMDILKLALTNTRKYGLCMVLGVQDFSQLYEIYGHDLAKTIISGCQTKLLLRVTDGAAAKLLAEGIGATEVDEKEETLSYGTSAQRDGVSVHARRSMRDLVLTSEILTLPDMTGYLIVPGDYPVARVKYAPVDYPKQVPGFVERGGFGISYGGAGGSVRPAPAGSAAPRVWGVEAVGDDETSAPPAPMGGFLDADDEDFLGTVAIVRTAGGVFVDAQTGELISGHYPDRILPSPAPGGEGVGGPGRTGQASPLADAL